MWLYKEHKKSFTLKPIKTINDMPKNTFGFIYEVTYTPTNEKYLGKKVLQFNKKHLTYLETKYLFKNQVLESEEYLNDNILGKFFRKDLVEPNS